MKEMKIIFINLETLVVENMRNLIRTLSLLLLTAGTYLSGTEWTTGTADIINLPNVSGTTNWQLGDDAVSGTINLDFSFDFYGETFTSGTGATNGCWTFTGYTNTCYDYTPDPLPQSGMDMTIFPLWGDWIRDSGSKMLYKTFGDTSATDQYFVMGWYNIREYNRNSNNTFEMLLYEGTNKIEFRYGNLNITKHDIIVGTQGHATASGNSMYNANEYKVYLHHNECASGTQHDSNDTNCVNTDWNNTSHNTAIENKSLSILLDDQYGCAANALLATTCAGYAAAYLTQQCNLDSLYSTSCPNYWSAYDDQQCDANPQYAPSCAGYTTEASVAYYVQDEFDYGYEEEYNYGMEEDYYWEDEYYVDSCIDNPSYCYDDDPYADMYFTDAEWYEIDLQEFGQTQVDEWYGTEVAFDTEGWIEWDTSPLDTWDELDYQMDVYDDFMETSYYEEEYVEVFNAVDLTELYEFDTIIREELNYEEEENYLAFEDFEELEEWYEEEMEESQETSEEQVAEAAEEIYEEEAVEEIYEDLEEEWIAEEEMTIPLEESADVDIVGTTIEREEKSSISRETALNVVASTIQAATNSVSGTTAGTSSYATGYSAASGNTSGSTSSPVTSGNTGVANAVASSSTGGGFSTSNSPSLSDQFASASVQTNTVLSMSTEGAVSNVSVMVTPMPTLDASPQVVMAEVQVQDMQGQIDTAVSGVMTASEADQVADQIIAKNIQSQQDTRQTSVEATGQYGDESTLVAYLGYNAGFTDYYGRSIPQKDEWYKPRSIYASSYLGDNINAFYQLAGDSLNTLKQMKALQPML
jgi:hypothetical protein